MFGNPFELRDDLKNENESTPDPFGRLGEDDEPDTEIAEIKNPTTLKAPVGDTGQNSRRDVAKTEQLLGQAGALDLKKTDGPTGYWGTRTSDATKTFQKQNGLKIDGQINPGGETIRALGKLAGQAINAAQSKQNITRHPREGGDLINEGAEKDSRLRGNDNGVGVLKLTEDAFSENQRAARYLASRDGIGEFSKFVADGIETHGEKAIAETVDLYHQTAEMNQTQADALIEKVTPSLSPENARRLRSVLVQKKENKTREPATKGNTETDPDQLTQTGEDLPSIEQINEVYKKGGLPELIQQYGPELRDRIGEWWRWANNPNNVDAARKEVFEATIGVDPADPDEVDAGLSSLLGGLLNRRAKHSKTITKVLNAKKPAAPVHMASEKASLYDGPQVHRPFEKDYPNGGQNGGQTDEAGNLIHDIDGRPLDPQGRIAGRRTVGMGDHAIARGELDAIAAQGTGSPVERKRRVDREGSLGATGYSPQTKRPTYVLIRDDLRGDDYESVLAHEVGHVIDQYVGEIDVPNSVRGELGDLYNTLNNPRRGYAT